MENKKLSYLLDLINTTQESIKDLGKQIQELKEHDNILQARIKCLEEINKQKGEK